MHCLLSTCHSLLILIPFEEPPHLTADNANTYKEKPGSSAVISLDLTNQPDLAKVIRNVRFSRVTRVTGARNK